METIHIYHTNDIHSHFKDWPRIVALLKERRQWHKSTGDEVFIFDIGDHIDRWHPLSDATYGKGNIALLNSANYDGVTIGNNEGITLPREHLNSLYEEAEFPVIVGNLFNDNGIRPNWAKPYEIFETGANIKIAVIGLTANFSLFYERLNWQITEPLDELANLITEVEEKADVIILLSHLGLHIDEQIANKYPEIDVILGAHTHHILHNGKIKNKTLLCCAGKFGDYVGHVKLDIEISSKQIVNKKAWLYDTNSLPQLADENEMITNLFMMGKGLLATEVTVIDQKYSIDLITQLLCDALVDWCEADCSLANTGLIIEPLQKGRVTKFDLLQICPHPINPATLRVTGRELHKIIDRACDDVWLNFQMIGFGFRGTLMGKFLFSGITFKEDAIFVNNKRLQAEETYIIAVPDMFTFGSFFSEISSIDQKQYFLPQFLRDLLAWKLTKSS